MRFVITGAAGFIGQSLCKNLLLHGHSLLALDSVNSYYSISLKKLRISELYELNEDKRLTFAQIDICDTKSESMIKDFAPDSIIHLAAQPGVRLGLLGAAQYSRDNIEAFLTMLKVSVDAGAQSFLYASSSSVYGATSSIPFSEKEKLLHPTSIYGITKLANELFASTIYDSGVKCRGMRFFSVYGPKGRPDMAYFRAIAASVLETQFCKNGSGVVARDFTYIDDVIESIVLLSEELARRPLGFNDVVNIGGGNPISINKLIEIISQKSGKSINVHTQNPIKEDLLLTKANYEYLNQLTNKSNFVGVERGIEETINWFLKFPNSSIQTWLE